MTKAFTVANCTCALCSKKFDKHFVFHSLLGELTNAEKETTKAAAEPQFCPECLAKVDLAVTNYDTPYEQLVECYSNAENIARAYHYCLMLLEARTIVGNDIECAVRFDLATIRSKVFEAAYRLPLDFSGVCDLEIEIDGMRFVHTTNVGKSYAPNEAEINAAAMAIYQQAVRAIAEKE